MECPICNLINPESAQRCDCGYDFEAHSAKKRIPRSAKDNPFRPHCALKSGLLGNNPHFDGNRGGLCALAFPAIAIIKGIVARGINNAQK
jgi:hypothetical protein